MVVTIKREILWGKYYITARDKKGFISKKKYSSDFNLKKAKKIFKSNNTFDEDITMRTLRTRPDFREFTDKSEALEKPRDIPFRVVAVGMLKDGSVISASSMSKVWGSVLQARQAANESFLERLAFKLRDIYDADEGLKLMDEVVSIKYELIYVK